MARADPPPGRDVRRRHPPQARLSTWHAADGWAIRRLDWPSDEGRGRILVQGGRGDFIEKYLETMAHFHARGWSVTAFDWRGQGGSGRLAADPLVGHAADSRAWLDDLEAFWREWTVEDAGPSVLLGHSMGGYLALRAVTERRIDPAALVLVAPMLGLRSPIGARAAGRFARWMAERGDPARSAWKANERPGSRVSRQRLLTGDRERYADELWWHAENPALRLGPPSWAWLAQAFAGTWALEHDPRLAEVTTPILMLLAEHDGLVDPRAARRVAARLPHADLVTFGRESAHEILREADPVRFRALQAIDAFLDTAVPA